MNFKGAAKKVEASDWIAAADEAGVTEAHIRTVCEVETAGSGFDRAGRPNILFEPHIFYRQLEGEQRDAAVKAGLAYPKWGSKPYPRTSQGQYDRMAAACQINETAALNSASWGLGQIMGSECEEAGFSTPQEMVKAFCDSEGAQLLGMAKLIKHRKLDKALLAGNWAAFARSYNGAGYRKNRYDEKLAASYSKWKQRVRDVPPSDGTLAVGSSGAKVTALQNRLTELRYIVKADGSFGNLTRDALMAFQKDNDIPVTGRCDEATWAALDHAEPREIPEAREQATVQTLRDEGSRIVTKGDQTKAIAAGAGALGGLSTVTDLIPTGDPGSALTTVAGWIEPLKAIKEFGADHWGLILLGVGVVVWYLVTHIQNARVEDKQTGKTV